MTGKDTGCAADPGCLSRIPDPKTASKEKGEEKFVVLSLFVATYHKIKNCFIFEQVKKKNFGPIYKEL
jgi:hypothetical protein